jgi:transcriptional regulator with XRE-family HTH domain
MRDIDTAFRRLLWKKYREVADRHARNGEFYSQTQFAMENHLSQTAMSSYMTGRRVPQIDTALELEKYIPGTIKALVDDGSLPRQLWDYISGKEIPSDARVGFIMNNLKNCTDDEILEILAFINDSRGENHHAGATARKLPNFAEVGA